MNGTNPNQNQWGTVKQQGQLIGNTYYPYEWKVEDKKPVTIKQPTRGIGTVSTVNLQTVDMKHVTQIPITQVINNEQG